MIKELQKLSLIFLSLILMGSYSSNAQSKFVFENRFNLENNFSVKELQKTLNGSIRTILTMNTPKGVKEFTVKSSKTLTYAGGENIFFEGIGVQNKAETVFIQCRPEGVMITYKNADEFSEFTFAKEEIVKDASSMEAINDIYSKLSPTSRKADKFIIKTATTARTNDSYVWVDQSSVDNFIKANTALLDNKASDSFGCGTADAVVSQNSENKQEAYLKNTTAKAAGWQANTEYDYISRPTVNDFSKTNRLPGLIGKMDYNLHLYDYGDVSDYDWGVSIEKIKNSISSSVDSRFSKIKLNISEYRCDSNGNPKNNGIYLTSKNLPWPDDKDQILSKMRTVLKLSGKVKTPNNKHLLLTRHKHFGSNKGLAETGGTIGYAQVWHGYEEGFKTPPHEFGHLLGAEHVGGCKYGKEAGWWTWYDDVMSDASGCHQVCHHTSGENKDKIYENGALSTITNEVLFGIYEMPSIADTYYAQDLFEVSDKTTDTSVQTRNGSSFEFVHYTGNLYDGQRFDGDKLAVYKVKFPANQYYQIKIIDANYDTYMTLLDKDGNYVASDDDSAGKLRSLITGNFNNDWYYIVVGGYNNQPGNFKLKVRYGWWDGGNWGKKSNSDENSDTFEINNPTGGEIDLADGNIIYTADFGTNEKSVHDNFQNDSTEDYTLQQNPINGKTLNIKASNNNGGELNYTIYSLTGALLQKGEINLKENSEIKTDLASGVYILRLSNEKTNYTQTLKFVIN